MMLGILAKITKLLFNHKLLSCSVFEGSLKYMFRLNPYFIALKSL